jgi:phosphopantothenoylcysteine decarboxylase/phosphopantothenate--cysteine ligase
MKKNISGKNILITAGPTWMALDKVRVLSNIASGRTGMSIAACAFKMGAKVTILLGPGQIFPDKEFKKNIRVLEFRYFDELYDLVKKEVKTKKYDIFIHSAAVSDYQPVKTSPGKIKSNQKELIIKLKPTIKIVDQIKKLDPSIFLVKFKLEIDKPDAQLIDIAYKSMLHSKADLVVANTLKNTFIVGPSKEVVKVKERRGLAEKLLEVINRDS